MKPWTTILAILLVAAGSASGQEPLLLDERCTATVGNQTALVQPDGSFLVRNVGIFQPVLSDLATGPIPQLFRVRATCVRGGEMLTGQSGFFELGTGETAFIADVFPTALDPIPERISAFTLETSIGPVGSTQLRVTAIFPDGSTEDVTPRAAGTTYVASNPAVAAVDEDGRVEGRNREPEPRVGRIVVVHEGSLAIATVEVRGVTADLDEDGLPDEYEELFGFDPETPDSAADLDGDGLSNLAEFEIGTLPNQVDTDLDGLGDAVDPDPLRGDVLPPTVTVTLPPPGAVVREGETIVISARAEDDVRVVAGEVFVNGESLCAFTASSGRATCTVRLTVPFEAEPLRVTATATDHFGRSAEADEVVAGVVPDPLTEVRGTVADRSGNPVEGAEVTLRLSGFVGELFDFTEPLAAFPDLSGRAPDALRFVSSLALRNPNGSLSPDTLGAGMTPDFAARFSGFLDVEPGTYTYVLGADDGARLSVDGAVVAEVVGGDDFAELEGTFTVTSSPVPVEIEYFQAVGDSELLFEVLDGAGRPIRLPGLFPTPTGADGGFAIPGVPTILGEVTAEAMAEIDGELVGGNSEAVAPVPGGVTEVGEVSLLGGDVRILLHEDQCDSVSYFPTALANLGLTATLAPTDAELALRLSESTWDVVLVDSFGPILTESEPLLADYVARGGRIFIAYRHWTAELAAVFEADLVLARTTAPEIFPWVSSPLLEEPHVMNRMRPRSFTACLRDDAVFGVVGGAVALAGSSTVPEDKSAKLVLGNGGRTVLFGGKPGNFTSNFNFNGRPDGLDLAENVVTFLVRSAGR